ncbi:hypothetical protein BU14_0408s0012 [Porphyra umbilicalis]|uniref:Protein kinase domain-containing protein n=1 Tax=Porphyra umbilicalis TaxID=2786 RepID=A0A1X6NVS5_PORUM|nr:hypothetical protein BU14_0408s0012 [Porphyra umbilicalis]|eukprot:OSX72734.1 hypothetical protein BU14_0408s0012 [Porphyra umbilicalis]
MAEVIDPLDLLQNGPDNERVFETSTIVYTDGCDRYVLRTSRHCDDKPLEVLTGLLPGLLAAAQEKVADKERQVAPGDVNGPPVLINPDEAFPEFHAGLYTLAPDLCNRRDLYPKYLSLVHHGTPFQKILHSSFLSELTVLEELHKMGGHPNIVKYHGVIVERGRMVGLVLSKMKETVHERCKEASAAGCSHQPRPLDVAKVVQEVEGALAFLHNLKDGAGQKRPYCHNDVHPGNVMLTQDDTAVLVNLNSCQRLGTRLIKEMKIGWSEGGRRSAVQSDRAGLAKVEAFMRETFKGTL